MAPTIAKILVEIRLKMEESLRLFHFLSDFNQDGRTDRYLTNYEKKNQVYYPR